MSKLPPSITQRKDFKRIYLANKVVTASLVFFFEQADAPLASFVASKKVGNAVFRNRAKRVMRAAFREVLGARSITVSCILLARHGIVQRCFTEIRRDLAYCLRKSKGLEGC